MIKNNALSIPYIQNLFGFLMIFSSAIPYLLFHFLAFIIRKGKKQGLFYKRNMDMTTKGKRKHDISRLFQKCSPCAPLDIFGVLKIRTTP